MSPVLFVLSFLAALLAVEGVYFALQSRSHARRGEVRRRLRRIASASGPDAGASLLRADRKGRIERLLRDLPAYRALDLWLYRAGMAVSPTRFLGTALSLAVASGFAVGVFFGTPGAYLAALVGGAVPFLLAGRAIRRRLGEFERQFPDALDLLIRALRAGHSLSVGMQMVAEELPDPVGTEFALAADEIQLGKEVSAALANLARRMPTEDVPYFVVAVTIQQETGSNLAEVLENLSSVVRERFKLYGKVRALTAMGRASANLLAVWPVVMVGALSTVNPDYIRPLFETDSGHSMLITAAVMIAIGYVGCRRLATIRV